MSYLANHPKLGLCVVTGDRYINLSDALIKDPVNTNKLLEVGDINTEVSFVADRCYSGERLYKFWIDTPTQYPSEEQIDEVVSICSDFGARLVKRNFGNYEFVTYSAELVKDRYPRWPLVRPKRLKPEDAVLTAKEIETSVITEYPEEVTMLTMADLVPEICKGESWAFSEKKSICLDNVSDDGYCIENNWEPRGDYWIFDSLPRGKRLIHSDILGYNKEFLIDLCS